MEETKESKSDRGFLKVISLFLAFFSGLIFVAAGLSTTAKAVITNLICGLTLVIVSFIFYAGYRKSLR